MNMKMKLFYFTGFIAIFLMAFFIGVPKSKAYINPSTYKIIIEGDGTTTSKVVTIKAQTQLGDNWICFNNPSGTSQIQFNNTGQTSYSDIGVGQCIDNWSYIKWDISGYDGNALYGLKTVYIKVFGDDYTSRSVVYNAPPIITPPTPEPAPTPQPESKPKVVGQTQTKENNQPVTTIQETPKTTEVDTNLQDNNLKEVGGTSTATKKSYTYLYIILIILLFAGGLLIGINYQKIKNKFFNRP